MFQLTYSVLKSVVIKSPNVYNLMCHECFLRLWKVKCKDDIILIKKTIEIQCEIRHGPIQTQAPAHLYLKHNTK